jgi:ribosomal protein L40E
MDWIPSAGEGASAIWERFLLIPLPVIILWIIWMIYNSVKNEQTKEQHKEATTKICPECLASIPRLAKKCMHCGSQQPALQVSKQSTSTKPLNTKLRTCPHCSIEINETDTMCFSCLKVIK